MRVRLNYPSDTDDPVQFPLPNGGGVFRGLAPPVADACLIGLIPRLIEISYANDNRGLKRLRALGKLTC